MKPLHVLTQIIMSFWAITFVAFPSNSSQSSPSTNGFDEAGFSTMIEDPSRSCEYRNHEILNVGHPFLISRDKRFNRSNFLPSSSSFSIIDGDCLQKGRRDCARRVRFNTPIKIIGATKDGSIVIITGSHKLAYFNVLSNNLEFSELSISPIVARVLTRTTLHNRSELESRISDVTRLVEDSFVRPNSVLRGVFLGDNRTTLIEEHRPSGAITILQESERITTSFPFFAISEKDTIIFENQLVLTGVGFAMSLSAPENNIGSPYRKPYFDKLGGVHHWGFGFLDQSEVDTIGRSNLTSKIVLDASSSTDGVSRFRRLADLEGNSWLEWGLEGRTLKVDCQTHNQSGLGVVQITPIGMQGNVARLVRPLNPSKSLIIYYGGGPLRYPFDPTRDYVVRRFLEAGHSVLIPNIFGQAGSLDDMLYGRSEFGVSSIGIEARRVDGVVSELVAEGFELKGIYGTSYGALSAVALSAELSSVDHKLILVAPVLRYRPPEEWLRNEVSIDYHRSIEPLIFGISSESDRNTWNEFTIEIQAQIRDVPKFLVFGTRDSASRKEDLNPITLDDVLLEKPVTHDFVGLNQIEFEELLRWIEMS